MRGSKWRELKKGMMPGELFHLIESREDVQSWQQIKRTGGNWGKITWP